VVKHAAFGIGKVSRALRRQLYEADQPKKQPAQKGYPRNRQDERRNEYGGCQVSRFGGHGAAVIIASSAPILDPPHKEIDSA
jgi:hypothetical protein